VLRRCKALGGGAPAFEADERRDRVAPLISYVLDRPVAEQADYQIVVESVDVTLEIDDIHRLRCRPDFPD
jgi:hypothetical protein